MLWWSRTVFSYILPCVCFLASSELTTNLLPDRNLWSRWPPMSVSIFSVFSVIFTNGMVVLLWLVISFIIRGVSPSVDVSNIADHYSLRFSQKWSGSRFKVGYFWSIIFKVFGRVDHSVQVGYIADNYNLRLS